MGNLTRELKKLLPPTRKRGRLAAAQDRTPIPAGQGVGKRVSTSGVSTGGGVASPLTEKAATRTYHPFEVVTGSDGLEAVVYAPIDATTVVDAVGATIVFNYLPASQADAP